MNTWDEFTTNATVYGGEWRLGRIFRMFFVRFQFISMPMTTWQQYAVASIRVPSRPASP